MLEHLHAGDDVEARGGLSAERLHRLGAIVDVETFAGGVQAGDVDHAGGEIDGGHDRACARHRLCEQSAAAADIGYA